MFWSRSFSFIIAGPVVELPGPLTKNGICAKSSPLCSDTGSLFATVAVLEASIKALVDGVDSRRNLARYFPACCEDLVVYRPYEVRHLAARVRSGFCCVSMGE